jgi:hypothetical protein
MYRNRKEWNKSWISWGRVMRNYKKQIYIYLHGIRAPGTRNATRTVATSNDYQFPIKNEGS